MNKKENEIEEFFDLVPSKVIEEARNFAVTQKKHRLNLTSWGSQIIKSSGAIIVIDLEPSLVEKIKSYLLPVFGEEFKDHQWLASYNLCSRLGYLAWHDDSNHVKAATIYANRYWDKDWFGLFVYKKADGSIGAVQPEFGKCVVLHPPILHATTMPTIDAPLRETIQVFVNKPVEPTQTTLQQIDEYQK